MTVQRQVLLLPEAEAPRLHRPLGQGVDQHPRARRLGDEHVTRVRSDAGREFGPVRQKEASNGRARAGRESGRMTMRPSAVTAATCTTSGSCGVDEWRRPFDAALRMVHGGQRNGIGAPLRIRPLAGSPLVGNGGRPLHRHPPGRIDPGPASCRSPERAGSHLGRRVFVQRQRAARAPSNILRAERRPCAPCARPSSAAPRPPAPCGTADTPLRRR